MTRKKKKDKKTIIPPNKEVLHARRDLITNVVIPLLKEQGFMPVIDILDYNDNVWGWSSGDGYRYALYKIDNGKFIYIYFFIYVRGQALTIDLNIYDIAHSQSAMNQIRIGEELWHRIRWKDEPIYLYPGCAFHSKNWWYNRYFVKSFYYRLKFFITRLGFKIRVKQLKRRLIKDFSNVQSIIDRCLAQRRPKVINFQKQKVEDPQ